MARRREFDDGGYDERMTENPHEPNPFGNEAGPGIGSIIEMLPDIKLPGEPPAPDGTQVGVPGDDESGPYGNRTTARELFDRNDGLPRGMTVQGDEGFSDEFGSSMSVPGQSFTPSPISGMTPNPSVTRRVSSPGAQSALFADASGGTPLFGRAGGLQGGGKGILGADEGGPTPTEMMLSLLRMFRSGA